MNRTAYFQSMLDPAEYARLKKPETVSALLASSLLQYPDAYAYRWPGHSVSYAEFARDVARTRGFLCNLLPQKGAHVGLLLGNNYSFARLFFAVVSAGYTAVLFPAATPTDALSAWLKKYDAACLIHDEGTAPAAAAVQTDVPVLFAKDCFVDEETPAASWLCAETPAAILFSGGTTGAPKGALLTHGALMRGAYNGALADKKVFGLRYLLLIPLTHVFGLVRNALTAFLTASSLFFCEDMKQLPAALSEAKPTTLVLVPALADMLFRLSRMYGAALFGGALTTVIAGGAPVPPELIRRYASIGIRMLPGYGLTETANLVSGNGDPEHKPSSVGVPYPAQELRIVDGELLVRGDHLLRCYYGDPEETAAAFLNGFFRTGDLARFDEDGYLYIIGCSKNIIVRENGENVSPEMLEAHVNAIPFVQDSLVYESINAHGQKVLVVEVLPEAGAVRAMGVPDPGKAIRAAVDGINTSLPAHARIQTVIVRTEDFPRSPSLKIIRPKR